MALPFAGETQYTDSRLDQALMGAADQMKSHSRNAAAGARCWLVLAALCRRWLTSCALGVLSQLIHGLFRLGLGAAHSATYRGKVEPQAVYKDAPDVGVSHDLIPYPLSIRMKIHPKLALVNFIDGTICVIRPING